MNAETKDGLQQGLAQLVCWLRHDYDGAKALHDAALDDEQTWPLNQALLFLAEKGLLASSGFTETAAELIEALQADLAALASGQEDE
jgi:hypothetical protein